MTGDRDPAAGRLELACRFLLSWVFLSTGLAALGSPVGFAGGLAQMGVPFPAAAAAATILLTVIGSAMLIADPRNHGWLAAFALALFTAISIPFGHAFWRFDGSRRTEELRIAFEHVSLIGGLLLAGLASLQRWRARRR